MGTKPSAIEQTITLHQSATPMLRDTNALEKNIRVHGLRGPFAGGLAAAAREHTDLNPLPDYMVELQRLDAIEVEMQIAATKGDTAAVRRLSAEKQTIELAQERRTEADLALLSARQIAAPEEGEEQRVEARVRELNRQIARKRTERTKLLLALAKQPESENLLSRVEKIDEWLADVQPEAEELAKKQAMIAAWRRQQEEAVELEKSKQETKRQAKEREADEKSMADLAGKMVKDYLSMRASAERFNAIVVRRMTKAGQKMHWNLLDDLRMKINRETKGACVRGEGIMGGFVISDKVQPEMK